MKQMSDLNSSGSLFRNEANRSWTVIEHDLYGQLLRSENGHERMKIELLPHAIFLVCALDGRISAKPSFRGEPIEIHANEASMVVFPREPWHIEVTHRNAQVAVFVMSLQKLHDILSVKFDQKNIGKAPAFDYRALPDLIPYSPAMQTQIKQIFQNAMEHPFREIFQKAKFLELFSTLMNQAFHAPVDECPFVISMEIEEKLADVRRSINQNLDQLPDIDTLAIDSDLPKSMLQKGFRYVYGKTIHSYYQDLRMDQAMAMLESGQYLVKEIAYKLGYQNPSHFISAFKKRFGSTPKQYIKQI